MPRKLKPSWEKRIPDSFQGVPHQAVAYANAPVPPRLAQFLVECGFSKDCIFKAERIRGRYLAELSLPTKREASRVTHDQLKAALAMAHEGGEDELVALLRKPSSLNILAFHAIARGLDEVTTSVRARDGYDLLSDLCVGGVENPHPKDLRRLRQAIPRAVKNTRLLEGRPTKEAELNLTWSFANLWREATGKWPTRARESEYISGLARRQKILERNNEDKEFEYGSGLVKRQKNLERHDENSESPQRLRERGMFRAAVRGLVRQPITEELPTGFPIGLDNVIRTVFDGIGEMKKEQQRGSSEAGKGHTH